MDMKERLIRMNLDVDKFELNTSVDCVIFTIKENSLKVLLTSFLADNNWMLPGGFIGKKEDADTAAQRILEERTGAKSVYLEQFKVFSNPNRFSFSPLISNINLDDKQKEEISNLPKRVFSIGYFALVNFAALKLTGGVYDEDTTWIDVLHLPDLMHDHEIIIQEAVKALQKTLFVKPIGYNLLPVKFTMPELQKLYEVIFDKPIERSSFQRKMLKWGIYERLEERKEGVAHKRPFLYRFDVEKYVLAKKQGINFGI